MKTIRSILISLTVLSLLFACSDDEDIDLGRLQLGFAKSGIEAGENAGILKVPLMLEGISEYNTVDVFADVVAVDGSAKNNSDYKFTPQTVRMNRAGQYLIEVEILDNDRLETMDRTFKIRLERATDGVAKKITEIEVAIIDDDLPATTIEGHYTLLASDFVKGGTPWSSEKGKVLIEKDPLTPGKYWMRNLELISEDGILLLTLEDGMYFNVDDAGNASLPFMQGVGDYGGGEGVIVGLEGSDGQVSGEDIPLVVTNYGIQFNIDGIAAIVVSDRGIENIYYALRNVILKKTK